MDYYQSEKFLSGSTDMPYEAEFVTNPLSVYEGGPEDSRWVGVFSNGWRCSCSPPPLGGSTPLHPNPSPHLALSAINYYQLVKSLCDPLACRRRQQ
jgi:hypothetical protein